jgi:sugar/nucleoside kinase (ribokinase family)
VSIPSNLKHLPFFTLSLFFQCYKTSDILTPLSHLNCNPTRCIQLVNSILRRRKAINPQAPKPLFIWEPVPDLCIPTELLNTTNALPYVDICSPNHTELASLMGDPDFGLDPTTGLISTQAVERACEQLLGSMPLQSYALVVRCGAKGIYVAKNGGRRPSRRPSLLRKKRPKNHARGGLTPDMNMEELFSGLMNGFERACEVAIDPGVECWLPSYWSDDGSGKGEGNAKVVDPTGGGNGFLGGLAIALARGKELEEAACWGSVAASFAIEQVGMPTLGTDEQGKETWNGAVVEERWEEYLKRVKISKG